MGSVNYEYEWNPLRQEAPECWAAVHTVIATEDPEGLLCSCAPAGEYDPAVTDLVRLVLDEPVVEGRVLEIWEHWFGPGSSVMWHPDMLQRLTASLAGVAPSGARSTGLGGSTAGAGCAGRPESAGQAVRG